MTNAIEVENLTKYYGDLAAIKDTSFNVDKGENLAFLGPDGTGKKKPTPTPTFTPVVSMTVTATTRQHQLTPTPQLNSCNYPLRFCVNGC